ncbi:MAG: putative bifunctional diguanylate cyclase/phosphodiesterase [Solirubrobacteraceae bacterium]
MEIVRVPSGSGESSTATQLRALLDLARLVRGDSTLPAVLDAVAQMVSDALGFETVVINLYREEGGEYEVTTVHGNDRARHTLLGDVSSARSWATLLDARFRRRGAFFVPAGALDWNEELRFYTPELRAVPPDGQATWHADDVLLVPMEGTGGRHFGIISVDEPASGLRPDDQQLDVLVAIAALAAQTIENSDRLNQLQSALIRHRTILGSSLDGVIAIDAQGEILEFNPAAERIFGYRAQDALGRELAALIVAPEEREAHRHGLARAFAQGDWKLLRRRIEVTGIRADGRRLPVELSLTLVNDSPDAGPVMYGFVRDISERRRGEEQLAFLAYHDPLTGLPNRALVEQQLDLALARARRSESAVALMFVDLDDFKEVNDRLGHAAGDELLTGVAARLRGVLRDSDILARQGGDEFLVVLSDLNEAPAPAAELVGAKLLGALREPFVVGSAQVRTGASVGVSLFPDDAADTETLLRHADAAMYRAKGGGGARLAFHQPSAEIVAQRVSVSAQLRRAMSSSELELHYQPIWRLGGERGIDGVEALLRWRHPERGLLRLRSFMSLVNQSSITESSITEDVTEWVLDEVCRHAAAWYESGLTPRISINISYAQLLTPGFGERFAAGVSRYGLDASRFIIELTESAWTVDAGETLAVVADLRAVGAILAIDDFGAGYSSLSRLRELAFDVLKIDGRVLTEVPDDPAADAVLRAIVDLARACEAEIIAEGVESAEQLAFLTDIGITLAQGFLFGHPRPVHEITALLARRLMPGQVVST